MPTALPVACNIHTHTDTPHDLVTNNDSFQQFLAGATDGIGNRPCGGNDNSTDVGLGLGMHIIQFQLMGHQTVNHQGGEKIGATPKTPKRGGATVRT